MLFFPFWLPWQPELWVEFNLLNNFGKASPTEHPCQVSSRLAQWFRRRRCLKKLWTTHKGHWAITKAHHEHFVLRWAKKVLPQGIHKVMWNMRALSITIQTFWLIFKVFADKQIKGQKYAPNLSMWGMKMSRFWSDHTVHLCNMQKIGVWK